jgi:hypothetical protein
MEMIQTLVAPHDVAQSPDEIPPRAEMRSKEEIVAFAFPDLVKRTVTDREKASRKHVKKTLCLRAF